MVGPEHIVSRAEHRLESRGGLQQQHTVVRGALATVGRRQVLRTDAGARRRY